MLSIGTGIAVIVAVVLLGSIAVVNRVHRPAPTWSERLRSRFVRGVPWGTLVVVAFVLAVYLFVQDGITDFDDPVTIPFRSWSYFYPLGMLAAPVSHAGSSHLTGNLIGTIVAAPIAEYAWGHYTTRSRTEDDTVAYRVRSWWTNPWVRALVVFPLAALGVALLTSLFALGPVIGFSGVVFAFVGFAIVHYPIVTIVAVLGVQGVVATIYRAIQNPIVVHVAQASPPGPPSWATIAIQGHALGFFIGLVLGALLLRRRNEQANVAFVWLAVLLYGFSSSLWAIYWFGGANTYILFRGPGVVVVTILSLVVALGIAGPETPIVPRRLDRLVARLEQSDRPTTPMPTRALELASRSAADDRSPTADSPSTDGGSQAARRRVRLDRIREICDGASRSSLSGLNYRNTAFVGVLMVFALLAGMAIPINFLVLDESTIATESSIEIDDYTITYAEDVENELTSGLPIEQLESDLQSSGVIVTSERRQLWHEAVSTQRLAFSGEETIHVGGPGWREAVHAERTGWEPVGNDTVYQVHLREDGGENQLAYESNRSQADVTIADRNVTVVSDDGAFALEVDTDETTTSAAIPTENDATEAGGLTFEREDRTVYATVEDTEVQVVREETYN